MQPGLFRLPVLALCRWRQHPKIENSDYRYAARINISGRADAVKASSVRQFDLSTKVAPRDPTQSTGAGRGRSARAGQPV